MATAAVAEVVAEAAAAARPNFKRGLKKIYLPNHRLTFCPPNPNQPPTEATFIVPMRFNKLDMRDYLYHAYNVEVTSVRSFITNSPLTSVKTNSVGQRVAAPVRRPLGRKMMTVVLVKPFVFPQLPQDLTPWDNKMYKRMMDEQEEQQEMMMKGHLHKHVPPSKLPVTTERISLAQRAQRLRDGVDTWSNDVQLDEKWRRFEAKEENEVKSSEEATRGEEAPKP